MDSATDSAADSLLALSNVAAAAADPRLDDPPSDDDRSSSLSELEDDDEDEDADLNLAPENDSEAETERLQTTPENLQRKKTVEISPSKLRLHQDVDMRPEIEALTESDISSPVSSRPESVEGDLSDGPDDEDEQEPAAVNGEPSPNKRKRAESESETEEAPRSQRRRTGSVDSEDDKSDRESEADDNRSRPSREPSAEPQAAAKAADDEEEDEEDEEEEEPAAVLPKDQEKLDTSEDSKEKARTRPRRKAKGEPSEPEPEEEDEEEEEEEDVAEESDGDENDAEAQAKSEEEQAKRLAAMDALTSLEKHFAALRDRLYDERIAGINHELALLQESKPSHPELLRQLEAVEKYRDEKFEVEQKLLVYKVGALKNKSVADRAAIHSGFYQTVRDIRERHLERISEHFYRIQRDRFKADSKIPSFSIPFPERRSQQIIQQTAYNKEVSILSGVAKYVGFPAAPDLGSVRGKDLDDDLAKMGISTRPLPQPHPRPLPRTLPNSVQTAQAEEQFLEQTPWANPQHPIHRLNRQASNRSPSNEHATYLTPAQQRPEAAHVHGSASTVADPNQPSSLNNTPYDQTGQQGYGDGTPGSGFRVNSASPLDTRRDPSAATGASLPRYQLDGTTEPRGALSKEPNSSPLMSRATIPRPNSTRSEKGRESPFRIGEKAAVKGGWANPGPFSIARGGKVL